MLLIVLVNSRLRGAICRYREFTGENVRDGEGYTPSILPFIRRVYMIYLLKRILIFIY